MMEKLIVLRSESGAVVRGGPRPRASNLESAAPLKEKVKIEVVDANKAELREVQRDPSVSAYARPMPLSLIKPRKTSKAAGLGQLELAATSKFSWGVTEVCGQDPGYDGGGVTVAILDTGICRGHLAFQDPELKVIEEDFTGTGDGDTDGHGTHCAGTIFGRDVNGVRIGVAPGIRKALIGKVIGGNAGTEALVDALLWALSNGAQVISMSLGIDFPKYREWLVGEGYSREAATSQALEAFLENIRLFDAIMELNKNQQAIGRSAVIVAAAGNESGRDAVKPYVIQRSSPSAAAGVISVGALMQAGTGLRIAPFSNTNPTLVGPGVGIVSAGKVTKTKNDALVAMDGTSMACPHIAGLAALHWQAASASDRKSDKIGERLKNSCRRDRISYDEKDVIDIGQGLPFAPR